MSPRKLTEDDKQEILQQYRNSEATTSTLAESFEVSSSTISRFLKNKLSTTEYEDLIQQKRLARTPRGEKSLKAEGTAEKTKVKSTTKNTKTKSKPKSKAQTPETQPEIVVANDLILEENTPSPGENEPQQTTPRRRRRRSTVSELAPAIPDLASEIVENELEQPQAEEVTIAPRLILDKKIRSRTELAEADDKPSNAMSQRLILKGDRVEAEEEDDDEMDIITLKEMLGEDLEDINDEEDEEDEEDEDWEDDDEPSYPPKSSDLGEDIKILPLSQALLPRTCYLVIDRSAELIVKPLADFADLGIIPDTEVRQRTLPVFDNHRIAKRFSHRRERVIKVPDGRMLQKTSHHLQDKGITRLLIDGQVYSISS
jgi:transposase-like protein